MLTSAKVNLKKYTSLSLVLLLLSYPILRSIAEFYVVLLVFLASCVNHWMLIYTVRRSSEIAAETGKRGNNSISLLNIVKLLLVVGALTFGVQIMGKRVIIPVLIYVLQIVVLYLSLEKEHNK